MKKMKYFIYLVLAAFLLCPASMLKASGQTRSTYYVCGKSFTKPFPIGSNPNISFRGTNTFINGRLFHDGDIDSITFSKPESNFLNALGQQETVTAIKGAAVLDITERIGENETTNRNVYSAEYMLEVAGMPAFTTSKLSDALQNSRLIVVSSVVNDGTFSDEELQSISQWVNDGGILVMSGASVSGNNSLLAQLVGYGSKTDNNGQDIRTWTWNANLLGDPTFEYIDTDVEKTIVIAKTLNNNTQHYFSNLNEGIDTLAFDKRNRIVALRYKIGNGYVYSYGVDWGLLIQQSQLRRNTSASRGHNNTSEEPSADVIPFQLRSIYNHQDSKQPAIWKFTIPAGYESVLIPTHDCDSKTALDSMFYMADYEKELGARCHYFITVHYFREPQTDNNIRQGYSFTPDRIPKIQQLINQGHTVGSHSIGHFPDFDHVERFPMTVITDSSKYHPMYDNRKEIDSTRNGSTWCEVNLSKMILESSLHQPNNTTPYTVKAFRTGHLCRNDSIPSAEKQGGYLYASCATAHEMASEFPHFERMGHAFEGDFNGVLEMALHYSDVYHDNTGGSMNANNWRDKIPDWKRAHKMLLGNYAPGIILIHPNRRFKMLAEKELWDSFDHDRIGMYNFQEYGEFWKARQATNFSYGYDSTKNQITIHLESKLDDYGLLPFAIEGLSADNLPTVHLTDPDNNVVAVGQLKQLNGSRYLCVF